MSVKYPIQTDQAPVALGPYSPAIKVGNTVYFSGQIALDPITKELISGDIQQQIIQVFDNLKALVVAAGGTMDFIVRVGIYLTDLKHFSLVNETMAKYFREPFPARSTIEVSALPKGAQIEVDAVMVIS